MAPKIAVIPGDGIGQEVVPAAVDVLKALEIDFEFAEANAGDAVKKETGEALPQETYNLVASADATLFGAAGKTGADVILPLRNAVESFVSIRPVKAYPGINAVQPKTDLVFLRENTEGVYTKIEDRLTEDVSTLTRVVTKSASSNLAEFACNYISDSNEHDSFSIVHKANVMRETDSLFRDTIRDVADERGVDTNEILMDAFATQVCLEPEQFDVIVSPNLAGDILSDLAAGLVGGLGLLPSANIGPDRALFEPVHGTAPDIAGEGIANPVATILSASMLLEHLGYEDEANTLHEAVESTFKTGPRSPDLGGDSSTKNVTNEIITQL